LLEIGFGGGDLIDHVAPAALFFRATGTSPERISAPVRKNPCDYDGGRGIPRAFMR
jgi:hypothetical protein